MIIKRQYIVDEQNQRIAVQLEIKTFEQIEEILENYVLNRLIEQVENDDETFNFEDAKDFYAGLKKADAN